MADLTVNHEAASTTDAKDATISSTVETHSVSLAKEISATVEESQTEVTVLQEGVVEPLAVADVDSAPITATVNEEVQQEHESVEKEPLTTLVTAGTLAYRLVHATLPIYRKRHFFFRTEPTPLEDLHTFYTKVSKNKAVEKTELHELIAYASVSGKGLLFWSKNAGASPSGIIACSSITEVISDEKHSDRFHVSCKEKSMYIFETKDVDRSAWMEAILMSRGEADHVTEMKTSTAYLDTLKSLNDGTAYGKNSAEVATDISSDEEVTPAIPGSETKPEQPKAKRSSAFFSAFKDKMQQDNTA